MKPENIVFDEDGKFSQQRSPFYVLIGYLVLVDFGLAKFVKNLRQLNYDFIGSPGYFAPEVYEEADGHNASVDWWGLGILIYELLHGVLPFHHWNE